MGTPPCANSAAPSSTCRDRGLTNSCPGTVPRRATCTALELDLLCWLCRIKTAASVVVMHTKSTIAMLGDFDGVTAVSVSLRVLRATVCDLLSVLPVTTRSIVACISMLSAHCGSRARWLAGAVSTVKTSHLTIPWHFKKSPTRLARVRFISLLELSSSNECSLVFHAPSVHAPVGNTCL